MISFMVDFVGILFIALIVWWFLIAKPKAKKADGKIIEVIVQNGTYTPALIEAKCGQTLTLRFVRKDTTPCSEFVLFEAFNLQAKLPIDEPYIVTLPLAKRGEFVFTCQMGMYRGKLNVI